jgi:hypothetical protein
VYGFDHDGPGTLDRTLKFAIDHDLSMLQAVSTSPFVLLAPLLVAHRPGSVVGARGPLARSRMGERWDESISCSAVLDSSFVQG